MKKEDFLAILDTLTKDCTDDDSLEKIKVVREEVDRLYASNNTDALNNLDKEWREKYRAAFFNGADKTLLEDTEKEEEKEVITIDDIFIEKKGE